MVGIFWVVMGGGALLILCFEKSQSESRGGSRTAATSKVELFGIIVNGFIAKSSSLDSAAVLDPPLKIIQFFNFPCSKSIYNLNLNLQ